MTKQSLVDSLITLAREKTALLTVKLAQAKDPMIHDFRKGYAEGLSDYNKELLDILQSFIKEEMKEMQLMKRSSVCRRYGHDSRVVFDGTENYATSIKWCSRCGAIFHPVRLKNGSLSRRLCWQYPRA